MTCCRNNLYASSTSHHRYPFIIVYQFVLLVHRIRLHEYNSKSSLLPGVQKKKSRTKDCTVSQIYDLRRTQVHDQTHFNLKLNQRVWGPLKCTEFDWIRLAGSCFRYLLFQPRHPKCLKICWGRCPCSRAKIKRKYALEVFFRKF